MNAVSVTTAVSLALAVGACVFPSSAEYEQAQAQHFQRMCAEPNYAYESGYNAGLERKRLDTQWVDYHCYPAHRAATRTAYQNGYQTGIQNAPQVVQVRGMGGYGHSRSYVESCRFSSDCGEGRTCRNQQCMGQGWAGDACWFGSDCLSDSCDISAKTCK